MPPETAPNPPGYPGVEFYPDKDLGPKAPVRNPATGSYFWNLWDALDCLRRGEGDALRFGNYFFDEMPHPHFRCPAVAVYRCLDLDVGHRTRANWLRGFGHPPRCV